MAKDKVTAPLTDTEKLPEAIRICASGLDAVRQLLERGNPIDHKSFHLLSQALSRCDAVLHEKTVVETPEDAE